MDTDLSQETVLTMFLDAKLCAAQAELVQAERFYRTSPGPYTAGRVQWCGHQLAAIRALRRDAGRPGQIIERWQKREKGKGRP